MGRKSSGFAAHLRKTFRGEVLEDAVSRASVSRDASLFRLEPALVIAPLDGKDVAAAVAAVNVWNERYPGEKYSLTPRGAGTDMTGGPLTTSIVLDLEKHMNRLLETGEGYAVAEPGLYYRDFDHATRAGGHILPSYPASREICTVGGMAANNSGGEKTLAYGKTADYVEELKVVLADGHEYRLRALSMEEFDIKARGTSFEAGLYQKMHLLLERNYAVITAAKPKVSKNSAGYALWDVLDKKRGIFDLTKLFIGSQGTLGIMSEIHFRLIRPHPETRMLVVFMDDLALLPEVTTRLLEHKPESVESYDDHTFTVALKYLPELMRHVSGNFFSLALRFLPEFWMAISGGVPKLVLLAEFAAETGEAAREAALAAAKALENLPVRTKVTKDQRDGEKYWAMRRESFNLLRRHTLGLRTAPFIDDLIVSPGMMGEFLPKLYEILNPAGLTYTVAGHVGDGNFHIIPLMDLKAPRAGETIRTLMEKVYALVFAYGGSMTAEHNDGLIRTPFLRQMYGEEVTRLFEETKKIFDPQDIFNPGKKVGGKIEENLRHLDFSSRP